MTLLRRMACGALTCGALLGMAGSAQAAPVLYGVTFGNQLITIDTATGAGTLVGSLSSAMGAFGLASYNGHLYTYDQTADLLRELNLATGATIGSISLGLGDLVGEGGMDFRSDGTGVFNATSGATSTFYNFTTSAGSGSLLGTEATSGIDGLAFNSANILYALGQTNGNLYTVNTATAALTLVGFTGFGSSTGLGGLAFLDDGHLYGTMNDSLYLIDTTTGAATLIGAIGFSGVSGLDFVGDAAVVPEPGTLLLVAGGVVLLARRRFTRQ